MPKKNKTDGKENPAMEEKKSAQYSDQTVATGTADEVHQTAGGDVPLLTTQQGCLFPMIRIRSRSVHGTDGARGFSF